MKEIKLNDFQTIISSLKEISLTAGGIFVTLTNIANSETPIIGKYVATELSKLSNDTEDSINTALAELENIGFIKIYKDEICLYKNKDNNISGTISIAA